MLLTSTYSSYQSPSQYHAAHSHTPPRPSPLSPARSTNAPRRLFDHNMASQPPFHSSGSNTNTSGSQRAYKPNPLIQTRDAATKRRRDMFFRRVQDNREEKKWAARGEQIQQLDFVAERKRWEKRKEREAPTNDEVMSEGFVSDAIASQPHGHKIEQEMSEVEYMLAQEEYELERLVASLKQDSTTSTQHYGSDDEDYDEIFLECLSAEQYGQSQRQEMSHSSGHGHNPSIDMDVDMEDE